MAGKSKRGISQPCRDGTNNDTLANQHCDSMGVFPFSQQRVWCQSFFLLSVRVNAIWTLKRNFGAGSINASFFFKDFNYQKINLTICVPRLHQMLWSKSRIIDPNNHKQAQQPLEKTTSRSLHVLPLPPLEDSGSAEIQARYA